MCLLPLRRGSTGIPLSLFVDKPRPFPKYPGISYFTNGAGHQYHGVTVEAERQMAKGLHYKFSWAWARDIGDLNRGASPENPFDRKREVAVWEDIPTHRITSNWIYQFPFGKGRKFLGGTNKALNLAVGGWELSGVGGVNGASTGDQPGARSFRMGLRAEW